MLNITSHQRNASQNYYEIPLHSKQNGCDFFFFKKGKIITSVGKVVKKSESLYTAGGKIKWTTTLENSLEDPQIVKYI